MHSSIRLALAAAVLLTSCQSFILKTGVKTAEPYFLRPDTVGAHLEKLTDRVYTFHWTWYRSLVIVTDAGLVVIDPMGEEAAKALRSALDATFPGKKVSTLIYSHYHFDHTRGGAPLHPAEVIADVRCAGYWKDFPEIKDVLPPTRTMSGDQTFTFGGVEVRALYLGRSHTDTLYAFHLPSERLVWTADLGLVRTMPPAGVPDMYLPGYLAALDRVAAIDFDIFVPSHFSFGKKQDLVEYIAMLRFCRATAQEAMALYGPMGNHEGQFSEYFDYVFPRINERYGEWNGFGAMFITNMFRDISGITLGI